eukprot:scaffold1085_cov407-Prasinococcus_capsulatus_cf.AAC.30
MPYTQAAARRGPRIRRVASSEPFPACRETPPLPPAGPVAPRPVCGDPARPHRDDDDDDDDDDLDDGAAADGPPSGPRGPARKPLRGPKRGPKGAPEGPQRGPKGDRGPRRGSLGVIDRQAGQGPRHPPRRDILAPFWEPAARAKTHALPAGRPARGDRRAPPPARRRAPARALPATSGPLATVAAAACTNNSRGTTPMDGWMDGWTQGGRDGAAG